jgi:hypothetical protein
MKFRILQIVFCLFLVATLFLNACDMPGDVEPTQVITEVPVDVQPQEPPEGTPMSWVDGSTLVFDGNVWIYESEVTNHQFSLCVEAGNCEPVVSADEIEMQCNGLPAGERDATIECNGFLPAGEGGASIECNGFLPSDNGETFIECNGFLPSDHGETLIECNGFLPGGEEDATIECNGFLPSGEGDATIECNGFLPAGEGEALIECNGFLPAGKSPSTDFNSPGLLNSPVQIIGPDARQAYCEWAGGRVATDVEGVDGFRCIVEAPRPMAPACQTSATYVNWPPVDPQEYSVTQVGQFCQNGQAFVTLDFNIPECASIQSVQGDCEVLGRNRILCHGESGAHGDGEVLISVCDSALSPAEDLQCPPGYEMDEPTTWSCSFTGALSPASHVMQSCPVGSYWDPASAQCVGQPQAGNECVAGFHFDDAAQCCQTDLPSGRYPSCPDGQAHHPVTGACDSENVWQNDGLLHVVRFDYVLDYCTPDSNGGGDDDGSAGCSSYSGKDGCNAAGCSWDPGKNTCN